MAIGQKEPTVTLFKLKGLQFVAQRLEEHIAGKRTGSKCLEAFIELPSPLE